MLPETHTTQYNRRAIEDIRQEKKSLLLMMKTEKTKRFFGSSRKSVTPEMITYGKLTDVD
jgi:hypothetical protein